MPFISCHIVGNITNIPLETITHKEECTQEAGSKKFLDTRTRKTTCCPSLAKLKTACDRNMPLIGKLFALIGKRIYELGRAFRETCSTALLSDPARPQVFNPGGGRKR